MGAAEWTADREISVTQAAGLIAVQFPQLAGLPVHPLAAGWDNSVFAVGNVWAFRFPRREIALSGVRRELELLPRLAPLLPLPVPVPEFVGEPAEGFPWPFAGSRLLHGMELAELAEHRREEAGRQLGRFLRALHRPEVADKLGADLPVDPMRRADPTARIARTQPHIDALAHVWQPDGAVHELYADACALGPSTVRPALVHGDLHLRHLFVDARGHATGVIDWGDVCLADPCVDLILAYGGFVGGSRSAFFDAYGPVSRDQELRARVLSLSVCAALAASAEVGSRLQQDALAGLRRSVAP